MKTIGILRFRDSKILLTINKSCLMLIKIKAHKYDA